VCSVVCRAKVVKHNQRLKKKAIESAVAHASAMESGKKNKKKRGGLEVAESSVPSAVEDSGSASAYQDQGFTRPRVLVLCPFRSSAMKCVDMMRHILGTNTSVANLEKFTDEFSNPDTDSDSDNDDAGGGPETKSVAGTERGKNTLPDDWKAIFSHQNIDDDFKMGIQMNPGQGKGSGADKGVYMRLFADFAESDIIIASPIGLRFILEKSGSNEDLLSSIESIVLYQADVMYMQNWDHVQYVLQRTNKLPTNHSPDTDFSRVRPYFLEGLAAQHRQLVVLSAFNAPDILAAFREYGHSKSGKPRGEKFPTT
jgi:U3 small nucleolar RNA-associated protein 25